MQHFNSTRFDFTLQYITANSFPIRSPGKKNNILLNCFTKVFGNKIGSIIALYVIREIIKLLMIVMFPNKLRPRQDHKFKIIFVLSKKLAKFKLKSDFELSSFF